MLTDLVEAQQTTPLKLDFRLLRIHDDPIAESARLAIAPRRRLDVKSRDRETQRGELVSGS